MGEKMKVLEFEVEAHDWSKMECGCGEPATHVPADLLRMARAQTPEEARPDGIDNHVVVQSWVTEVAVPVTRVIMAGLAGGVSLPVRREFLKLLSWFVIADDEKVAEECKEEARSGIWSLYEEVLSGRAVDSAGYAFEILEEVEGDSSRVSRLREKAGNFLPADLR